MASIGALLVLLWAPGVHTAGPPRPVNYYWNAKEWSSAFHFEPARDFEHLERKAVFYAYDYEAPGTRAVNLYWSWLGGKSLHLAPAEKGEKLQSERVFFAFPEAMADLPLKAVHRYSPWHMRWSTFHFEPAWPSEWTRLNGKSLFYAFDDAHCAWPVSKAVGRWEIIGTSTVPQDYTVIQGIVRGGSHTEREEWRRSTTHSLSMGFTFSGIDEKATVSGTVSHTVAHSFAESLRMTVSENRMMQFPAGVHWQFKFASEDACGDVVVNGPFFAHTANADQEPCCLPGYSSSATDYQTCLEGAAALPDCGAPLAAASTSVRTEEVLPGENKMNATTAKSLRQQGGGGR